MAMLTTPARSPSTPPSAPKTSGIASATAPPSRLTTRIRSPAAAQLRKPIIQTIAKAIGIHIGWLTRVSMRRTASAVQPEADHHHQPGGGAGRHHDVGKGDEVGHRRELERRVARRARAEQDAGEEQGQHAEHDRELARARAATVCVTAASGARPPLSGVGQVGHGAHLASWAGSRKIARTRGGAARKRTISDCTTSTRSTEMFSRGLHGEATGLEGAEQEPGGQDAERAGAAEQRHGDGVEADRRVEVERDAAGHGAEHLVDAGEAEQGAGDHHHDDVDPADVDAGGARRVRVLADGADAVAEGGAVEQPPRDGDRDERDHEAEVEVELVAEHLGQRRRVLHRR